MAFNLKFIEDASAALVSFPKLKVDATSGNIFGDIDLVSEDGEFLDSYSIEIHSTESYPRSYPVLYERSGKIPHNIDWHVYPDGHCCLSVPVEEKIECSTGITLTDFLKKQVLGFLYSQTFRRRNGYFYRERSHGLLGSIEFYLEYLHLRNFSEVYQALSIANGHSSMKSNAKCFCKSQRKFRKCHRRPLRTLKKMGGNTLEEDFNYLKQGISKAFK